MNMKVFLTAFAMFDDIGAVLLIAIFYSSSIYLPALYTAQGLFLFLLLNIRRRKK